MIGLLPLLFLALLILKLGHVITIGWWLVAAPIWAPLIAWVVLMAVVGIIAWGVAAAANT